MTSRLDTALAKVVNNNHATEPARGIGGHIESVSCDSLANDPANVRRHGQRNLEAIKASLARFGQQRPILANAEGVVIAGNGTLMAARALGWKDIKVVRTNLTGTEATAYAIADNRTAELAEWDDEALAAQMAAIAIDDEALADACGFDAKELADLMPTPEVVEDEVPEPPETPITQRGDIWTLGRHRLMCGDSTNKTHVAKLMNGIMADVLVTDPPYGIGYEYDHHDDADNGENAALVEAAFGYGPPCKIWTPGLSNLARDIARFGKARVLVWFKKFAAAGNGLGGASVWEPILIVGKPETATLATDVIECMTERIEINGVSLRELHTCPKPVRLYCTLLQAFTDTPHSIYEPFCGSGTTLIACEQLNRTCYGMEISPAYCDVIVKRWENLTGQKAVRNG